MAVNSAFGRLQYYGTAAEKAAFTPLFVWTQWIETDTSTIYAWDGSAWIVMAASGGSVGGSGVAGRVAEWSGATTMQASTLAKTGAGVLTLSSATDAGLTVAVTTGKTLTLAAATDLTLTVAGASTINGSLVGSMTGGGTIATGGFTGTLPKDGTLPVGTGDTNRVGYWADTNTLTSLAHPAAASALTQGTTGAPAWMGYSANPGAAASLLATDTSGYLQLVRLGLATAPSYPLHVSGQSALVGNVGINTTPSATYTLNVVATAVAGTVEEVAYFGVADNANSSFVIKNSSATNGIFSTTLVGMAKDANTQRGLYLIGETTAALDTGTVPLITLNGRVVGAQLTVRPILTVSNYARNVFTVQYTGEIDIDFADTATNAISTIAGFDHNTSGTAAAGFGTRQLFRLKSSTTADQSAGAIDVLWADATHGSRSADLVLYAYNTTNAREGLRVRGGAAGPEVGLYGAAPVARAAAYTQTYSTAARTVNPTSTAAFTGIDNLQVGAVYAQLTDLNTLRTDLLEAMKLINSLIDDSQAIGIAQ